MSLYEVLKASKTERFPDYWTLLWGRKLSASMIKTLTGTLPLTFVAKAGNLLDWMIYGNNNVGKNLIRVPSIAPVTDHGVTFTFDAVAGTITANGTATGGQGRYAIYIEPTETIKNVYLSGCPAGGSASSFNAYPWDSTAGARPKKWDGVTAQTDSDYGDGNLEVQVLAGHKVSITLRIEQGYTANNVVFKPMYRKAGTSPEFEPYQIGIGKMTKNYANVETGTTAAGVTFTFDHTTGTVTANGKATSAYAQCRVLFNAPGVPNNSTVPPGNYYFSGCPIGGGSSTYDCYSWDNDTNARSKQWDGTTNVETDNGQGNCQVQINGHSQSIVMRIKQGYTANNVVFKPMLRAADTDAEFIPYGYEIPLTRKSVGDLDRKNSTVGFLKANGEIVTDTDFITTDFIPVQANTHLKFTQRKTTSYDLRARLNVYNADKTLRQSYWEGIDFQADSWSFTIDIAQAGYYRFCLDNSLLSSVETTTTYTVPIDAPLTEGQSVSDTVEITAYKGINTLDTTLYNKPEVEIKYK